MCGGGHVWVVCADSSHLRAAPPRLEAAHTPRSRSGRAPRRGRPRPRRVARCECPSPPRVGVGAGYKLTRLVEGGAARERAVGAGHGARAVVGRGAVALGMRVRCIKQVAARAIVQQVAAVVTVGRAVELREQQGEADQRARLEQRQQTLHEGLVGVLFRTTAAGGRLLPQRR
eukprot:scaffold125775_cov34-Phaeocystis_antarctica.AAC.1